MPRSARMERAVLLDDFVFFRVLNAANRIFVKVWLARGGLQSADSAPSK